MFEYQVALERVVDGDTVRVMVDHGMYIRSSQAIRLIGVDAPERWETDGPVATEFVVDWFATHTEHAEDDDWPFILATTKDKRSFNRYLGEIECGYCGVVLNHDLHTFLGSP